MFGIPSKDYLRYHDLDRAARLVSEGKLMQALEMAQRFSVKKPDEVLAFRIESAIAEACSEFNVVLSSCQKGLLIDPENEELVYRAINACLYLGDQETAAQLFAQASKRLSDSSPAPERLWELIQLAGQAFAQPAARLTSLPALPSQPLVSVIIPTTNRPMLLKDAIASLIGQRYQNWEAIIVHSRPEQLGVAFGDSRIRVIETGKEMIAAQSRNVGLESMRGDIFCFLDDDDLFHANHLELAVQSLRSQNVVGAFADADLVFETLSEHGERQVVGVNRARPGRMYAPQLLQMTNYLYFNEPVFRRDSCGHLRFDENLPLWEDWDFLLGAFSLGLFARINATTCEVRRRTIRQGSDHMSVKDHDHQAIVARIFQRHPATAEWINLGRRLFVRHQISRV